MERIELILKNYKLRRYHLLAWLLAALNLVILFIVTFTTGFQQHSGRIYFLLGAAFLLLIAGKIHKFNLAENKTNVGLIYLLVELAWLSWHIYWAAALNLLFFILYIYSVRRFEVIVTANGIIYPSFPKRNIQWNELQNIILKDGILTIDFKNNKIIQNDTEEQENLNEKTFNEFCTKQLKK